MGDSRVSALPAGSWQPILQAGLVGASFPNASVLNYGVGGTSVASTVSTIDATLAAMPSWIEAPLHVLLNWGRNDTCTNVPAWQANYLTIIGKIHAKWPLAQVYLMRPWSRDSAPCSAPQHASIDTIVATQTWLSLGPDEAVWLEGGDDGATYTYDGTHYNAAGLAECAAQWQTVMGY